MTPNFLLGKTGVTTGKIIDVFPSDEVKTYRRKIKYIYSVNNEYYSDFKRLGTKDGGQKIGNDVKVIYSLKNPRRNNIEILLNNKRTRSEKFYSNKKNGYIEMQLINGVFKYKEFAEQGKIVKDFVGEYSLDNDSLKFEHYYSGKNSVENQKSTLFVFDTKNSNRLIDVKTKQIFRRVRAGR